MAKDAAISGFHKLMPEERLKLITEILNLSSDDVDALYKHGALSIEVADKLIENVIGNIEVPLGIATNFLINGKDYFIPMAIEEASVVAACSKAAKIARPSGGFTAYSTDPVMIGQIQVMDLPSPEESSIRILSQKQKLIALANEKSKTLREKNSGAIDIETRILRSRKKMLIVHLLVNVQDAMGANIVNTMCEFIAPEIERITGGRVNLRILSNLSIYRRAYATAKFRKDLVGGEAAVNSIMEAYEFAEADIFRAATHNKGVMNGIDAVLLATFNDWRAVEAGAHAFVSMGGYHSMTTYSVDNSGDIIGSIELPLAVGIVGGAASVSKKAMACRKILGVTSASELSSVIAAVGLAQNFSAIKALASEGIQKGHMKLHSRNIAISAGATPDEVGKLSTMLVESGDISPTNAKNLLEKLRKK